jgi:hypothetical protein
MWVLEIMAKYAPFNACFLLTVLFAILVQVSVDVIILFYILNLIVVRNSY